MTCMEMYPPLCTRDDFLHFRMLRRLRMMTAMLAVVDFQREFQRGDSTSAGEADVFDVGFGIGDGGGDFGKHAALIDHQKFQADFESDKKTSRIPVKSAP